MKTVFQENRKRKPKNKKKKKGEKSAKRGKQPFCSCGKKFLGLETEIKGLKL